MLRQIVVVFLLSCLAAAQAVAPERHVQGNVVTSERDPNVRIELPKSVQYIGADRWVLYDIADCELHAFIEAGGQKDEEKNIRQLYWVQFEGYVPEKPALKHTYDSPRHATIGGLDFYVDTWVRANEAKSQSGSDREHIEALLRKNGYRMPPGMMYVRLVHLLDASKRKELMIIYGEDISTTGFTVAQLEEGGPAHDKWAAIETDLVNRAKDKIAIEEPKKP